MTAAAIALLTGILATGCARSTDGPTVRVAALDSVTVTLVDGKPGAVRIKASGRMMHGSNRNTELRPAPAEDRPPAAMSFIFVTQPPMGQMVPMVIQPVSAVLVIDPAPAALRTIRVFGRHDVIDARVPAR